MNNSTKLLVLLRFRKSVPLPKALHDWHEYNKEPLILCKLADYVDKFNLYDRVIELNPGQTIHASTNEWDGVAEYCFKSSESSIAALKQLDLRLLSGGAANYEIAEPLWIDPFTVIPQVSDAPIARFVLLRRRSDLSKEAFSSYWRGKHAMLVTQQVEIRSLMQLYVQNHVVAHAQGKTPAYDGIVEAHYASLEDTYSILNNPSVAELIREDEGRFIAREHLRMFRAMCLALV